MFLENKIIGLVSWDYAQCKGGMGRSLQWIAGELQASSFKLQVASPCPGKNGVPFLSFTKSFGGHVLFSILLPFVLGRWIRRHAVSTMFFPVGPGGVFLLRKQKIRTAAIVYHTYAQQSALVPGQSWKKVFLPLERRTLRMADCILCFCSDTHRVLREQYHIPEVRIVQLQHAVDTTAWSFNSLERQPGLCVAVARLEARKGIDVLLKAWPGVIAHVSNAQLIIVGDGIQGATTDAAIKKIGTSVERISGLSLAELTSVVGRAEVAVCPAYLEGFGLAAVEAMLSGAAVVAGNADGIRCLVQDEESGLLTATGDPQALADAIIRLLQDKALRAKLARTARKRMEVQCDPVVAGNKIALWAQSFVA